MTTVSYALGRPRAATSRGGDCRAIDLGQSESSFTGGVLGLGYNESVLYNTNTPYTGDVLTTTYGALRTVRGPHIFADTADCQITNGLLRLTLGASGGVPTLTVEAYRGAVTIGDYYVDTYADLYGGTLSAAAWIAMGTLTIDSPSVAAVLTGVRLQGNAEAVTIRLIAPLMADAYVTLRRGERMVRVQHGRTRPPFVDIDRRIRLTSSPSPTGTAVAGRVEEPSASTHGFLRFVASIDNVTTNAGAFSITAPSVTTARLGAGVGTYAFRDDPAAYHAQLGDASRPLLVVA